MFLLPQLCIVCLDLMEFLKLRSLYPLCPTGLLLLQCTYNPSEEPSYQIPGGLIEESEFVDASKYSVSGWFLGS